MSSTEASYQDIDADADPDVATPTPTPTPTGVRSASPSRGLPLIWIAFPAAVILGLALPSLYLADPPFYLRFTKTVTVMVVLTGTTALAVILHQLLLRAYPTTPAPDPSQVDAAWTAAMRRRGIKGAVIGEDGRASTSLAQMTLWTLVVLFAAVFLLLYDKSPNCPADSSSARTKGLGGSSCPEPAKDAPPKGLDAAFGDAFQGEIFLLLGVPTVAAAVARWAAQNKDEEPEQVKARLRTPTVSLNGAVSELVSDDTGVFSITDFQYVAFNLVAASIVFIGVIAEPDKGLPNVPEALLILAGVSAGSYSLKKYVENKLRPSE